MDEGIETVPLGSGDERLCDGVSLRRSTLGARPGAGWHAHGFHQVAVFLSSPGEVEWCFGEGPTYQGRPAAGDVVVCPASVPTLVRWERPFESISVRFSTGMLGRVARRAGFGVNGLSPAAIRRDRFAGEVARKLAEIGGGEGEVGRGLLAESLGTALAVHLLRDYPGEARPGRGEVGLAPGDLRRVTDHIEANLDGDLSVDRLAAVAGLSPHHFIRRFRASAGTTPHQYVIRRRVERAEGLLRSGCGISEAAARVGFSGQSHLHHHVRRLLGVTPGEIAGGGHRPSGRLR